MTTGIVIAIAIAWSLMSTGIAFLVVKGFVDGTWVRIQKAHPAVAPKPDAVRRNFQSFRMNLLNLGMSVHVAVDESHLHLYPAAIIRWVGARPASIPWAAVTDVGKGWTKRWRKVRIEGVTVEGPAWCLELAGSPIG